MSTNTATATLLAAGNTVHLLRGSKYAGAWDLATVEPNEMEGWFAITDTRGRQWFARQEDAFATEAEAREAAAARRKPRQVRQPNYGYGDGATLAMFARAGRKAAR